MTAITLTVKSPAVMPTTFDIGDTLLFNLVIYLPKITTSNKTNFGLEIFAYNAVSGLYTFFYFLVFKKYFSFLALRAF